MSAPACRARGFILLTVVLALTLVAAVAFLLSRSGGMNMSMAARGLQADSARYVAEAGLAQINSQTQNQSQHCTNYTDLSTTPFGADSFTATVNPKAGSPVTFSAIGTTAGGAVATLTRSNVPIAPRYDAALSSPTLQSADSTGTDTTLDSGNAFNYGANSTVTASFPKSRALLQFDLSDIPVGSRISSATLSLYRIAPSGGGGSVGLYRVTTRWTEGTGTGTQSSTTSATWTTANDIAPWSTVGGGGDYDPTAIDSTLSVQAAGWKSWNATSLVQGWADLPNTNYGMILVATGGGGGDYFSSDDVANLALHPKLLVLYYPPCSLGPAPVILGTAGYFVILTETGITDVPSSAITGNIGTSPIAGTAITGLTCAEVKRGLIRTVNPAGPSCQVTDPTSLTTAVGNMQTAYTDAAGRTPGVGSFLNVGGGTLDNRTLVPGTYTWTADVTITTDLTLSGGVNDVWIFQIPGILNMTAAKNVILSGGARAKNIFWQVAGGVILGASSHFEGIVLSATNITMAAGASMNGRLLAQTAVTLIQNTVTQPIP